MTVNIATAIPEGFEPIGHRLDLLITGGITLALLLIAAAIFIPMERRFRRNGRYYFNDGHRWLSGSIAGAGAMVAVIWIGLLWPYQGQYHSIYRVQGHVESASNVLTDASGELTRIPVLTLDTVDRPLAVNDSRAVTLEGADVVLTCTIGWHYQAADTYSCTIADFGGESR